MKQPTLLGRYYRARSRFYQRQRLLFPSPAEIRFIRLMGGHVVIVPFLKHYKTGFPMARILTLGKLLKTEQMAREVRVGSKYVDFGNDVRRGIEVDGRKYHTDIVEQIQRDEYFQKYDWHVLHIDATELYQNPKKVKRAVIAFLTR
jgi:hypothetical protein